MSDESRIFWVKDGPPSDSDPASRSVPENEKTVLLTPEELPAATRVSMKELFIRHYERIRDWVTAYTDRPGIAIVAMTRDAVHGTAFLARKEDDVGTAIIGRHTQADLRLRDDASLSLRHVALLVFPAAASGKGVRYRLVDLRTATGFVDERGKRLRALEADGPAFVCVGHYILLVFPTGDGGAAWPVDAADAWARLPDRLYVDEIETEARPLEWESDSDRAWEVEDLPAISDPPTLVHRVSGPEMAVQRFLEDGDSILGEALITSSRGATTVVLGRRQAQSGLLLGRSRRCDAGKVLSNRAVSRVHLLIIEIAGVLYAIDTASLNGVWQAEDRERATRLENGRTLSMSDVATLEWRFREEVGMP